MVMNKAKLGDRVKVQYDGLLTDGIARKKKHPGTRVLEFIVGSEEVISGISLGVIGMAEGQQKRLTLQPEDAYGSVRPKLIKEISRRRFPSHLDLQVGKRLSVTSPVSGRRRRVMVMEIKPNTVIVDGNHPLAGKVLQVEVQLLSLDSAPGGAGGA